MHALPSDTPPPTPMQFFPSAAVALLAAAVAVPSAAQSPLVVAPTGGTLLSWPVPSPNHQTFFDLTVATTITLQALSAPLLGAVGQPGTIELWLTNAGTTSYVGHEQNAARWHLAASGTVTANGTTGSTAQLLCSSCQDTGGAALVLVPGSYGCAIRYSGVGNLFCATPSATNTVANQELTLSGGAVQYNAFTSPPAAPGGGYSGWSWSGEIHYGVGAVPHACAEVTPFGAGCGERHASFYHRFATAGAAANALNGRGLSLVPNSSGAYLVLGVPINAYAPPTAAALQVAAGNDGESMQQLSTPLPYPGGTTSHLFIHANGFVSVGPNHVLPSFNWLPTPSSFLNASHTGWWIWHDLNPAEPGSGSIWYEDDPNSGLVYVTWLDVESAPNGVANPSTFQMIFQPSTGIVTMHFIAIDAIGGGVPNDSWLIGYSPGGASHDPGPTDLHALLNGTAPAIDLAAQDVSALALQASGKPRLGSAVTLRTSNHQGVSSGFVLLTTTAAPSALELVAMGAPGCWAWIDLVSSATVWLSNAAGPAGMDVALAIPSSAGLLGMSIYGQSAWLDATANVLGLVTSNALRLKVGSL